MSEKYSLNPSVSYVRVSPDEVIAKGGHLEGFSLHITDDTGRGLATGILDAVGDGATATEAHQSLNGDGRVSLDEVLQFLTELHTQGVLLRHDSQGARTEDWMSFIRFGEFSPDAATHPLVVAGPALAEQIVGVLQGLGLAASHTTLDELGELDEFAVVEPPGPPEGVDGTAQGSVSVALGAGPGREVGEASPERRDERAVPRLVVVAEGIAVSQLFDVNERAVAAGAPVLYTQVAGVELAVGPYVIPGATACFWEFERQRARSQFSYSDYAAVTSGAGSRSGTPAVAKRAAIAVTAPFAVELALLGHSSLGGAVHRHRATTVESRRHSILRLPRCPVCLPRWPMLRNPLF